MVARRDINSLELEKFAFDKSVQVSPGLTSRDAFGRGRTSFPFGVFDSKQIADSDPGAWDYITAGAGSVETYNQQESTSTLTVDPAAASRIVSQSRWYWPYVPGRSHLIDVTVVMGPAVAGSKKRVGYYDDDDGLYIEQDEDGTVYAVIRSSVTGSVVENRIPQSEWNIDTLDGTKSSGPNPSHLQLDMTARQIVVIDFQWLGLGTVRFGFSIDGEIHYVHAEHHANTGNVPYMRTPTLPVRYEIVNTTGGTAATMKRVCTTVISEGGYENPGFEFAQSNGINVRVISARTPILAIRQSQLYNSIDNRRLSQLIDGSFYVTGGDAFFETRHLHDPSSVTGNFVTAGTGSAVEYSTDITAITAAIDHFIDPVYASGAVGQRGGITNKVEYKSRHSVISRNAVNDNSHYIVVFATPFSGIVSVSAGLRWVEFS